MLGRMDRHRIAVAPPTRPAMFDTFVKAVLAAGGEMASVGEASALIWADPNNGDSLTEVVDGAGDIRWVQLPYAGIEKFASTLDPRFIWTCGKGVYAEPVAEHVIALALAGLRHLHTYIGAHH